MTENWRWETFKNCLILGLAVGIVAASIIWVVDLAMNYD